MPTSSGLCSLMASTKAWCSTFTPRSTTLKPLELMTVATMSLPKSWMSFLTVPKHQGAVRGLCRALKALLQGSAGLLEDVGGVDELGEEVVPALEALAYHVHAGLELFQDGEGSLAGGELLLHQANGRRLVQVAHCLGEGRNRHDCCSSFVDSISL